MAGDIEVVERVRLVRKGACYKKNYLGTLEKQTVRSESISIAWKNMPGDI